MSATRSKARDWLYAGGSPSTRPVFTGPRFGARAILTRPQGTRERRVYVSIQADHHTVGRMSPREALALAAWLIDTFRERPMEPETSALGEIVGAA